MDTDDLVCILKTLPTVLSSSFVALPNFYSNFDDVNSASFFVFIRCTEPTNPWHFTFIRKKKVLIQDGLAPA